MNSKEISNLLVVSRVTSPPPLSPLQISPISDLAQRLTGKILGAEQRAVRNSSKRWKQSLFGTNLRKINLKIQIKQNLKLLEMKFLWFGSFRLRITEALDEVTRSLLVFNSREAPANCGSSLPC